ncbi:hypothetical protein P3G55_03370 [Leptospira sp. 96542]|nr:hypothetical protein [Leptospira sp. 96542]
MSELTRLLQKIHVPEEIARAIETAIGEKVLAAVIPLEVKWEKERILPMEIEIIKGSERIESFRLEFHAFRDAQNQRFLSIDQRFAAIDKWFLAIDQRFAAIDLRFSAIDKHFLAIDQRFAAVDQRFASIDERFRVLFWVVGIQMSMTLAIFLKTFWSFFSP